MTGEIHSWHEESAAESRPQAPAGGDPPPVPIATQTGGVPSAVAAGDHYVADPDDELGASLVRPYARTGGRTQPGQAFDLEALVATTVDGREARSSPELAPEHATVIDMCHGTISVAEIAAGLVIPLGVARVIIADMVGLGFVEVMKTSAITGDERDPAFLRRVLSGLQRL